MFSDITFSQADLADMLYIKPKSSSGGPITESDVADAKKETEALASKFL